MINDILVLIEQVIFPFLLPSKFLPIDQVMIFDFGIAASKPTCRFLYELNQVVVKPFSLFQLVIVRP